MTFKDPVDGFPFHLVHGQSLRDHITVLPQLQYNFVCSDRFKPFMLQKNKKKQKKG